jgi:hypothetical protein
MSIDKESFWLGWIWSGIAFFICLLIKTHFFPNEFEKNGRKKLCELKQYEYCTKEELLKTIK